MTAPRLATFAGFLAVALLALALIVPSAADEQEEKAEKEHEWLIWYEEALEKAQENGRPVLVNFTGSDWCPPCIAQERNVFSKDEFKEWADENVVLLELDFPRQKEQSEELKEQNRALAQQYGVRGFPTVMVLTVEGEEVERYVGFPGLDVDGWIERTQEAVDQGTPEQEEDTA